MTRKEIYLSYLESEHWSNLRNECFRRANVRCESCNGKIRLVGHHMVYRNPLELGVPEEIMCLCSDCHNFLHRGLSKDKIALPADRQTTINLISSFKTRRELLPARLRKPTRAEKWARKSKDPHQAWKIFKRICKRITRSTMRKETMASVIRSMQKLHDALP